MRKVFDKFINFLQIGVVVVILSLFCLNALLRISEGPNKPSKGVVVQWIIDMME